MNSFQARGCSFFVVRPAIDKKSFGFFFFKVTWIVHFGVVQNDSEFKVQESKLLWLGEESGIDNTRPFSDTTL